MINRKSLYCMLSTTFIWGLMPLYWELLGAFDSMFIASARIILAVLFLTPYLWLRGQLPALKALFRNKAKMRYLYFSSTLIALNWGLYIWAMTNGHVLDSSLGYYMLPLMTAVIGVLVFKDQLPMLSYVAFFIALAGVVIATVEMRHMPGLSIALGATFTVYGAVKKKAQVDSVLSVTVESILVMPFCFVYITFFCRRASGIGALNGIVPVLLIIGAGLLTAIPMVLYATGLNGLRLTLAGFLQYINPTLALLCGLLLGETLTLSRLSCLIMVWIAIVLFSIATVKQEKQTIPVCEANKSDNAIE